MENYNKECNGEIYVSISFSEIKDIPPIGCMILSALAFYIITGEEMLAWQYPIRIESKRIKLMTQETFKLLKILSQCMKKDDQGKDRTEFAALTALNNESNGFVLECN